MFAWNQLSSEF